jgi:acetyl esterase/lipase
MTCRHPIEIGDMQRAIRLVRSNAAEWHLDPARICVMGLSAGGSPVVSDVSDTFRRP